jgi:uncharacterized protein YndB with AHSA1/START domain
MAELESKAEQPKTERRIERKVEIEAPIKNVWKALTEARALKNWFPLDARVTPGLGGKIFMSWGADCEGEAEIVAWNPGKHFAWREPTARIDFTLEPHGHKSLVRLVQSSFSGGSDWENEWFESTSYGWGFMLASLRWWLEVHSHETRLVTWRRVKVTLSREDAYRRLTATKFLFTEHPADVLRDGAAYKLRAATGERLSGVVEFIRVDRGFCLTVEELNKALLWFSIEGTAPNIEVQVWLSAFGISQLQAAEFGDRWEKQIRSVFSDQASSNSQ